MSYRFFDLAGIVLTSWPLAIIFLIFILKNEFFKFLENKKVTYKNQTKGMVVIIEEAEKVIPFTKLQRQEIGNLTANEIWALHSIANNNLSIDTMNPALKVMIKTFLELKLVVLENKYPRVTANGQKLLNIAENILKN